MLAEYHKMELHKYLQPEQYPCEYQWVLEETLVEIRKTPRVKWSNET